MAENKLGDTDIYEHLCVFHILNKHNKCDKVALGTIKNFSHECNIPPCTSSLCVLLNYLQLRKLRKGETKNCNNFNFGYALANCKKLFQFFADVEGRHYNGFLK